ncbi:MAG: heat-inducible transcriptional repressor HrcA [Pseudomonadota bacterium]|nr:heat-inducible transcriptional repressor HrcA [Alphaproteobacteria bacterium]MDP5012126.1 heat-inducible transcriptional repressor HrcA [Alphaproteobacteria bacterium]MDP5370545.1 heat-inducible transcriptional repressor HrcA [Pseudomonadota bacterium]
MSLTVAELNDRSVEVFREIIDTYIETGEPVGSRTLSRRLRQPLSPATIRNVMADLEEAGLLYAPHTSAGRLPTDAGLRYFVDGLLEVGDIKDTERAEIERRCKSSGLSIDSVLEQASAMLSGLSSCAGLVMAPKSDSLLKHLEFVHLAPGRALVVLISQDGNIENRIIDLPPSITQSVLTEASNFLSARIFGRTLVDARNAIMNELNQQKAQLDELTAKVVEMGLGVWAGGERGGSLIVKGQSHLLDSVTELTELDQIRSLFQALDTKETLQQLLDASIQADGVQIFIGAENSLFHVSGCSLVVSPYHNAEQKIIGAIGVIGPSRMNYSRIIPLVDYTAKIVGKLLG